MRLRIGGDKWVSGSGNDSRKGKQLPEAGPEADPMPSAPGRIQRLTAGVNRWTSSFRDRRLALPQPRGDVDRTDPLANRIRAIAKLDCQRQAAETQSVLEQIATLEPAFQIASLEVLAKELGNMDEQALTPALYKAILRVSDKISDAGASAASKYDGRDVLPSLASSVMHLRNTNDVDGRDDVLRLLYAHGVYPSDMRGMQILVNLAPAAKAFSADANHRDNIYLSDILAQLDMFAYERRDVDLALLGLQPDVLPKQRFELAFDRALLRLEKEQKPYRLGRDKQRVDELERLINALAGWDDEAEHEARSERLAKLIKTTPLDCTGALLEALRKQVKPEAAR